MRQHIKALDEGLKDLVNHEISNYSFLELFIITDINYATYTADIKQLNTNLIYNNVPLTSSLLGNEKGILCPPSIDDIVLVGFLNGSPSSPIILGCVFDNFSGSTDRILDIRGNELFLGPKSNGSYLFIDEDGHFRINLESTSSFFLDGLEFPKGIGTGAQVLSSDGTSKLLWTSVGGGGLFIFNSPLREDALNIYLDYTNKFKLTDDGGIYKLDLDFDYIKMNNLGDVDTTGANNDKILKYTTADGGKWIIGDTEWDEITGDQTDVNISGFTNDSGFIDTETDPEFSAWLLATPPLYPGGWYDAVQNTIALSDFNDDLSYEVPLTFSTGLTRTTNTITCDITQYTDSDAIAAIQGDASWNATDWDTAYGWGNHADAGYITDVSGLVPYTGATGNVDLGTYDLTTTGEGNFASTTIGTSGSHFEIETVTYNIAGVGDQTFPIIIPTSESVMTDMGGVFRRALIIEGATDGMGNSNPELIFLSKDFSTSLKIAQFSFTEGTETLLVRMLDLAGGTPDFIFEIDGDVTASNLNISNWDTAYGWGDHAGLYDATGTASGLIGAHESTYDHTLIATALQSETDPDFNAWLLATPPLYPGGWYDTLQSSIDISGFNNDSGFITGVAWDEITGDQTDISLSGFTDDLSYEAPLTFSTGLTRTTNTITCDITQYTDALAVTAIKADAAWNATNWDTAYGWGDHASEGYIVNPMTTAGDVIYGGVDGEPTRLAKGTATQVLTMNAGATAPEWADAGGLPDWVDYTIEHDAVEDELLFKYDGSTIMKLEADGTLHVKEIIEDI